MTVTERETWDDGARDDPAQDRADYERSLVVEAEDVLIDTGYYDDCRACRPIPCADGRTRRPQLPCEDCRNRAVFAAEDRQIKADAAKADLVPRQVEHPCVVCRTCEKAAY